MAMMNTVYVIFTSIIIVHMVVGRYRAPHRGNKVFRSMFTCASMMGVLGVSVYAVTTTYMVGVLNINVFFMIFFV